MLWDGVKDLLGFYWLCYCVGCFLVLLTVYTKVLGEPWKEKVLIQLGAKFSSSSSSPGGK